MLDKMEIIAVILLIFIVAMGIVYMFLAIKDENEITRLRSELDKMIKENIRLGSELDRIRNENIGKDIIEVVKENKLKIKELEKEKED